MSQLILLCSLKFEENNNWAFLIIHARKISEILQSLKTNLKLEGKQKPSLVAEKILINQIENNYSTSIAIPYLTEEQIEKLRQICLCVDLNSGCIEYQSPPYPRIPVINLEFILRKVFGEGQRKINTSYDKTTSTCKITFEVRTDIDREIEKLQEILKNFDENNEDIKNEDIKNEDIKNEDIKNEDIKNEDIKNKDIKNEDIKNKDIKNEDIKNKDIKNKDIKNEDIKNKDIKNEDESIAQTYNINYSLIKEELTEEDKTNENENENENYLISEGIENY